MKHGSACQWRYHNYSTYNHAPHESGGCVHLQLKYLAVQDKIPDLYFCAVECDWSEDFSNSSSDRSSGYNSIKNS